MKPQWKMGPKQLLWIFLAALVFYLGAFQWIEHMRHRKGPWSAGFMVGDQGEPELRIRQAKLGIDWITLRFAGERVEMEAGLEWVDFDEPGRRVPFGRVIYEDLTFLPGVVTFDMFGHEVELLPRVLLVNKREVEWESGRVIVLRPEEKPARPPGPPRGGTREEARIGDGFGMCAGALQDG